MNEPSRLRDEGEPGEAELLASAASDGPSSSAVDRTLAALGIGAVVGVGLTGIASASSGASSAGTSSASTSSAGTSSAGTSSAGAGSTSTVATASGGGTSSASAVFALTVKWIGVAGLVGVVAWAAIGSDEAPDAERLEPHWSAGWGPHPDPFAEPATALGEAHASMAEPPTDADVSDPSTDRPAETPPAAAPPSAAPAAAGPRSWTLTDEIAALDRARRALEGDPELALSELASYRARFPGGALRPEADALRVEALARAGRNDEAKDAAKRYGRDHPDSPHAERVGAAAE